MLFRSGSALVFIIEGTLARAAAVWALASAATLFGVIHSPHPSGAFFWPWAAAAPVVSARLAGAYGVLSVLCLAARAWHRRG